MKNIISTFLLICAMGVTPLYAQQEVIVGSGTDSSIATPISKIAQGATEMIYDGTEIGATGTIKAIGWNIASNPYNGQTTASVYMKMSNQSTIATTTSLNDYTMVYSGNIESGSLGWQNIQLSSPFNYNDATKNLLILIVYSAAENAFNSSPQYTFTTTSTTKTSYSLSESYQNPWNPSKTMSRVSKRPNIKLYFENTLSTLDITKNTTLKVYPNPVKNTLTILNEEKITSFNLYNLAGQKVKTTQSENGKETSLDLSEVPAGVYIIKMTGKNNVAKSIKIIKE